MKTVVGFTQLKKLLLKFIFVIQAGWVLNPALLLADIPSEEIAAEIVTSYNQTLDPKALDNSVSLEPSLAIAFPSQTSLGVAALIDRPMDAYSNFEVPRLVVLLKQEMLEISKTQLFVNLGVTVLDFHRWSQEGTMLRNSLGLSLEHEEEAGFSVSLHISPFYQLNEFRQTTAGKTKSRYGLSEKVVLGYQWGRTTLSAALVVTQRYTSLWKNDYSTEEQLSYQLDPTWSIGFAHALLGETVDETTGRYTDIKVFDHRKSLLSAFVGIKM